jgi:thermitase
MRPSRARSPFLFPALALAGALALACGDSALGAAPPEAPVKDAPAAGAPPVRYSFYEPTTEERLKADTNYGYLIAKVGRGFKRARFADMGLEVVGSLRANGATYYRLHRDGDVLGALREVKKYASVLFVEPEVKHYTCGSRDGGGDGGEAPTGPIDFSTPDTYINNKAQFGAFVTKAYDAWTTIGFGPHSVHVAQVDTGVHYRHVDLADSVLHAYSWWTGSGAAGTDYYTHVEMDGGGIPLDGERLLALLPDHKATQPNGNGNDATGHGTHTAGTMVAVGNNGQGVAGMAWGKVDLIAYKGFSNEGVGSVWSLYGSIWHLARWKEAKGYAHTIPVNFSVGGPNASQFAIDMVEHGLQNGIVMVAASGNDGGALYGYPAAYAGVVAVGATDLNDRRAPWSNGGGHISVVAPGHGVISCEGIIAGVHNVYENYSGTSMAAPHVTGLMGYMLTFNPDLGPDQLKTYIERCADPVGGAGFSEGYGWGRINVLRTIQAVRADAEAGAPPPSDYSSTVKVTLPEPENGMPVYLYNCDQSGAVANYVACSFTGEYLAGIKPAEDQWARENGVAYFNLLRSGDYIAKVLVNGAAVGSTEVFRVTAGQGPVSVPVSFPENVEFLTIQTMPTQDILASGATADTEIALYSSAGEMVGPVYDNLAWDTRTMAMPDPGTYYIGITEFIATHPQYATYMEGGEYALRVSRKGRWEPGDPGQWHESWWADADEPTYYPIAPGSYAEPGDGRAGGQRATMADAPDIDMDTFYYGCFTGPKYANPAATAGDPGHFDRVGL